MSQQFDLNFPRATSNPPAQGIIKQKVDDFYVEELLTPELTGEGEHVWLWLEKIGQNTEFVAEKLAQFSKVKLMDVGFSGLKDRWAITRQWFSIYLGNKAEPNWADLALDGVEILQTGRHLKKLRRGEHTSNKFRIVVRELDRTEFIDEELKRIALNGFPNYFGAQRFGINGANLERGERFFKGQLKASRSQRSFYLSAARSFLFNINLAGAVTQHTWLTSELGGPLYGDEIPGSNELTEAEKEILNAYPIFSEAIHKNRLKLERRPFSIVPGNLSWECVENSLTLEFVLPSGCFATSLIAEFIDYKVGLGVTNSES